MVAAHEVALFLCTVAVAGVFLQGCGGGGSGGCTSDQNAAHCSSCSSGKCTACDSSDYVVKDTACRAACTVTPQNTSMPAIPATAVSHNGIALPQLCIDKTDAHFFGLGDWGGTGVPPKPFNNIRGERPFVTGVDDVAQQKVADQMKLVAITSKPDYVLNVGDNFYPGGIGTECGAVPPSGACTDGQFQSIFEEIYSSKELEGKPWLGVLGNHDYGGMHYDAGWDMAIYRTWCPSIANNRWRTPAPYWSQKVQYADFAVDYFLIDSNFVDAGVDHDHNICNAGDCKAPTCAIPGLTTAGCPSYFHELWQEGLAMLEAGMKKSTAEWQIVVTHFPGPTIATNPDFARIAETYGVDLVLTGHAHYQRYGEDNGTPWIITGGGGGITSDAGPVLNGQDDAYGFVDFHITRTQLDIKMLSHGDPSGQPITRSTHSITPRQPSSMSAASKVEAAPAAGVPKTILTDAKGEVVV